MTRQEAIREFYYWQFDNTGSFYNLLCTLFQKADSVNTVRLAVAFPEMADAYFQWYSSPYQIEFFKEHGVWPEGK